CIMHNNIQTALFCGSCLDFLACISCSNVKCQCRTTNFPCNTIQISLLLRNVQTNDMCAITCQYVCNGFTDTTACTCHHSSFPCQRLRPVHIDLFSFGYPNHLT